MTRSCCVILSQEGLALTKKMRKISSLTSTEGFSESDKIPLGAFKNRNGEIFVEVEELRKWDNGPIIFTALQSWNIISNAPVGDLICSWN